MSIGNKNPLLVVEAREFTAFQQRFKNGEFKGQRTGQAFYNHFNLHRLSDQASLCGLYDKDGKDAIDLIKRIFILH